MKNHSLSRVSLPIKNVQMVLDGTLSLIYKTGTPTRACTKFPHILGGVQEVCISRKYHLPFLMRHTCVKEIGMGISNPGLEMDPSPNALRGRMMKLAPTPTWEVSTYIGMRS